jgi:2-aminoadipate transaminase
LFDIKNFLHPVSPEPVSSWTDFPKYNFVGGHNEANNIPFVELKEAVVQVLLREGRDLAKYGLESGPQGYLPLRQFITRKLKNRAGIQCSDKEILMVSGSLQALDLVNQTFLKKGDTVIIEEDNYGGTITRLNKLGINIVGIPLEADGMNMDDLESVLVRLESENIKPRYIYTIPTIQNPTGTIMSVGKRKRLLALSSRFGIPIFEDDCYADLIWEGYRPPAIKSFDTEGYVIYCGSFSKSIAPALRVGYLVAEWDVLSRIMPYKTDAGSGALEQMALAAFCEDSFDGHVAALTKVLAKKADAMCEAIDEYFGSSATYMRPNGGIFIWVTLPDNVDTSRLCELALKNGVAVNPGAEWSINPNGQQKIRLCFGNPSIKEIMEGIEMLATLCREKFDVPKLVP